MIGPGHMVCSIHIRYRTVLQQWLTDLLSRRRMQVCAFVNIIWYTGISYAMCSIAEYLTVHRTVVHTTYQTISHYIIKYH